MGLGVPWHFPCLWPSGTTPVCFHKGNRRAFSTSLVSRNSEPWWISGMFNTKLLLTYSLTRSFKDDIETAATNVLDIAALIDLTKVILKIKYHLLAHLCQDIICFGPILGSATKTFECFFSSFAQSFPITYLLVLILCFSWQSKKYLDTFFLEEAGKLLLDSEVVNGRYWHHQWQTSLAITPFWWLCWAMVSTLLLFIGFLICLHEYLSFSNIFKWIYRNYQTWATETLKNWDKNRSLFIQINQDPFQTSCQHSRDDEKPWGMMVP